MSDKLGATGKFPEGKFNRDDEGQLQFAVGHNDGKVFVEFGKSVRWFAMGPEHAQQLANLLIEHAQRAEKDYQ